jgi:hypothetical protein
MASAVETGEGDPKARAEVTKMTQHCEGYRLVVTVELPRRLRLREVRPPDHDSLTNVRRPIFFDSRRPICAACLTARAEVPRRRAAISVVTQSSRRRSMAS